MKIKTVKKSSHWWKHGKHKGALDFSIKTNKDNEERSKSKQKIVHDDMKDNIHELFETRKK